MNKALQRPAKELSQEDIAASLVQIEDYEFPFENLIFEGGGNKGTSYVGCLQCLEDIGLVSQIKRFAGSSIGSITAALIALGYTSSEIDGYMSKNKEDMIFDHSFGYLSLLPNLLKDFGWNPGNGIYKWFGDMIQRKSAVGNPDMTFLDLYKERKKELCVVVTNVNQMREEYCHIKTTPNMPIRDALRMSMAIPGWYLSMSPDDTFLQKMAPLSNLHNIMLERFREKNLKSLGFLLYDDSELEVIRFKLEKRVGATEPQKPRVETKLYKQWLHKMKRSTNAMEEHSRVVEAFDAFMKRDID
ncbi:uncharacterized protein YqhO-like [Biomphalaria glabrata]|uniref:Uncharacterized protein YqhO-like n=1 Tax=Biomphalaria glabrata TaxID=6526 RepID=A0A9W2YNK2_BIOGL|nr:uncharacterized protein YqhO-like [Biomphalaria glabrata]